MRAISLALVLTLVGFGWAPDPAVDKAADTKKAFGDVCAADSECQSGMCRHFKGRTVKKCTKPCTKATEAADCPRPPSKGMCTPNNYCKL